MLAGDNGNFLKPTNYELAGLDPGAVAVGDFNEDGKLDLVTANFSSSLSVLIGRGDGTFRNPVTYSAGTGSLSVAVGDFNGDGHLDIAAACTLLQVCVLLGTGGWKVWRARCV